jgi:hypothetical protein
MTAPRPSSALATPHFDLHIEDLVIDGFPPGESRAIAAALEQELGRLLARDAAPFTAKGKNRARPIGFERLDAGVITYAPSASPRVVGRVAAGAIVQQLHAASAGHATAPLRRSGP